MATVEQFNAQIEKFSKTVVPAQFKKFRDKLANDILRGVVKLTPVDTGRAQNNWQVATETNESSFGEGQFENRDSIEEGRPQIKKSNPYSTLHLFNNVEYIIYLEEGTPKIEAHGMIERTVNRMMRIFE